MLCLMTFEISESGWKEFSYTGSMVYLSFLVKKMGMQLCICLKVIYTSLYLPVGLNEYDDTREMLKCDCIDKVEKQ